MFDHRQKNKHFVFFRPIEKQRNVEKRETEKASKKERDSVSTTEKEIARWFEKEQIRGKRGRERKNIPKQKEKTIISYDVRNQMVHLQSRHVTIVSVCS